MRRVNRVFLAIVVGSALVGGVTAADFGTDLRTVDTITLVERQLDSTVTSLRVADGQLSVTVRLTNPTGYRIGLHGTFVRVFRDGPTQLAYGAGQRVDDGGATIPPRGTLTARYVVGLSPSGADRLRSAFESGPVRLTVFHSLSLGDQSFEIARSNVTVADPEVG